MADYETCPHAVALERHCSECDGATIVVADTGEIAMNAAEYTAFRERAALMFGAPGWESPELRALEANE
jgi:hypothetical protein